MTTLHSSSRKQLLLQLLNKRNPAQNPISKGFTLIELLVVIVILGILGAVGYQAYLAQIGRANAAIAQNTATALAKNCSALLLTEDAATAQTQYTAAIADIAGPDADVDLTGAATCGFDQDITVDVGTGDFLRSSTAKVQASGAVTPGNLNEVAPGGEGGGEGT